MYLVILSAKGVAICDSEGGAIAVVVILGSEAPGPHQTEDRK